MNQKQQIYETTVIVNASLDDAQIESTIARVQETITKNSGTITALNKWGRKRLAYPIHKKTNGYYVHIEFEGPPSSIGVLERAYSLDELILRHLTIKLSKNALKARAASLVKAAQEPVEETPAFSTREPLFTDNESKK
jgi:small subunit ribosomal protein S6